MYTIAWCETVATGGAGVCAVFSVVMKPAQLMHEKKGEQLPAVSLLSVCCFCMVNVSPAQSSFVQQGISADAVIIRSNRSAASFFTAQNYMPAPTVPRLKLYPCCKYSLALWNTEAMELEALSNNAVVLVIELSKDL